MEAAVTIAVDAWKAGDPDTANESFGQRSSMVDFDGAQKICDSAAGDAAACRHPGALAAELILSFKRP